MLWHFFIRCECIAVSLKLFLHFCPYIFCNLMYLYPCLFSLSFCKPVNILATAYDIKMIIYTCRYKWNICRKTIVIHSGFIIWLYFQAPEDCAVSISSIIRHHETEYLASLEVLNCFLVARIFLSFFLVNVANDHTLTGFISKPSWFYFQGTLYYIIPYLLYSLFSIRFGISVNSMIFFFIPIRAIPYTYLFSLGILSTESKHL